MLRKRVAIKKSLRENAEIVIPASLQLVNVIGDIVGVLPLKGGTGEMEPVQPS